MCSISGLVFCRFTGRGVGATATVGCMIAEATYRGTMHSPHFAPGSLRLSPLRWQALGCAPAVGVQMSADDIAAYLLSASELRLLTGRVKHRTQIGWLVNNNIPFLIDASGRPRVLRKLIESRLSGSDVREGLLPTSYGQHPGAAVRPNFAALDIHAPRHRGRHNGS